MERKRLVNLFVATVTAVAKLPLVQAQNVVVSSTAAWSSQIVAFWGAVGIGVRSSNGQQPGTSIASATATLSANERANAAAAALRRGNWYIMAPGYNGGKTRLDVVMVCWSSADQLHGICTRVAAMAEVVGRQRWLLLLIGRKLTDPLSPRVGAYWTQSPRCTEFCLTKFADNGDVYSAFSPDALQALSNLLAERYNDNPTPETDHATSTTGLVYTLIQTGSTRSVTFSEAPAEVHEHPTIGRHFTSVDAQSAVMPYMEIKKYVGEFASSRKGVMRSAVWMYFIVHGMVSVAVGLMGAASGRGFAVWLFAPRMVMSKIGAAEIPGDDALLSLLAFDRLHWQVSSEQQNVISIAGDAYIPWRRWERLHIVGLSLCLNVLEFLLVTGGWLYGALRVEKLKPRGLVGHGMLWLSTVVSIALSLRTLLSVYRRLSGRLIGIFEETNYLHRVIGRDCVITSSSTKEYLRLVSDVLTGTQDDDEKSIIVALSLMRQSYFGYQVGEHTATQVLEYAYEGDKLIKEVKGSLTTPSVYPWIRICMCVLLTIVCSAFGPVYAYATMPKWSKLVAEVLLATSATWFATLVRTSKLSSDHSTQICHMVATMVSSAVWYVGVKDVG